MIAVGVDTHKERHYAVALDQVGQLLTELSFAATAPAMPSCSTGLSTSPTREGSCSSLSTCSPSQGDRSTSLMSGQARRKLGTHPTARRVRTKA